MSARLDFVKATARECARLAGTSGLAKTSGRVEYWHDDLFTALGNEFGEKPTDEDLAAFDRAFAIARAANDPRLFAAVFGRQITGATAHGFRSRKGGSR